MNNKKLDDDIGKLLLNVLNKFAKLESIDTMDSAKKKWDKNTSFQDVDISIKDDLSFRSRLLPCGRILEENLEEHFYILLVKISPIGGNEALLVAKREENRVCLAAYAKEGLIHQHLAQKAVEKVENSLRK